MFLKKCRNVLIWSRDASEPHPEYVPTLNAMQNILRAVNAATEAADAERKRRVAWEKEQEAKYWQREAELQSQVAEMKSELLLLKATMSLQQRSPSVPLLNDVEPTVFEPPLPAPSAHIEEVVTPTLTERCVQLGPMASGVPAPPPFVVQPSYPTFVEGSSISHPPTPPSPALLYPADYGGSPYTILPSPALTDATVEPRAPSVAPTPAIEPQLHEDRLAEPVPNRPTPIDGPHVSSTVPFLWHSTTLPSPAQSLALQSPPQEPTPRALGKRRAPPSLSSRSDSDSSDGDESSAKPNAPRKRRNGHDQRCLTIQVSGIKPQ